MQAIYDYQHSDNRDLVRFRPRDRPLRPSAARATELKMGCQVRSAEFQVPRAKRVSDQGVAMAISKFVRFRSLAGSASTRPDDWKIR